MTLPEAWRAIRDLGYTDFQFLREENGYSSISLGSAILENERTETLILGGVPWTDRENYSVTVRDLGSGVIEDWRVCLVETLRPARLIGYAFDWRYIGGTL
jgi:hypothetical protein